MSPPEEYHRKFTELGLDNWAIKISSITEAHKILARIAICEKSLWEMKHKIKEDIDNVWADYFKVSKELSQKSRPENDLDALREKREKLLNDYEDIKWKFNDMLSQLKAAKNEIYSYIRQRQAEQQTKQKQDNYNPNLLGYSTGTQATYYEYIKSPKWRERAEEAKARAGNRCQVCNRSRAEVQLDAHHRTYERLGNELPEDITILCRDCHQLYEDAKKIYSSSAKQHQDNMGYCIRCKTDIRLNLQAPYCYSCYSVWKKFENRAYKEKYCHNCGVENSSSFLKPVCLVCYIEQRERLIS